MPDDPTRRHYDGARLVHRVRVPLARITGADSLGTDIELHTEPEFGCVLWEGAREVG